MAFRSNGCTILFCSHSPYHIRHLCDVALWLDGGQVAQFGATEPVLAAYDQHTRKRQSEEQALACSGTRIVTGREIIPVSPEPDAPLSAIDAGSACILSVDVKELGEPQGDRPGVLHSSDLVVTITVRGRGNERPNIGFMIEQSKGVGMPAYVSLTRESAARWHGFSEEMAGHAGRDIGYCHLEKLHNLESLPGHGFMVSCFPHKIKGASAGWTRAVAIFED